MLSYLLFALGFVLLIKGAQLLIKGSSSLAKKYHISDIVIGLTIVSLGTSLPELIINLFASFNDNSSIAIGNIFGSNVANIFLILGLSAVFSPLPIRKSTLYSEIPFAMIATLLAGFLANATFSGTETGLFFSRADGFIMIFFFFLFMVYIFRLAKDEKKLEAQVSKPDYSTSKSYIYIGLGIVMLFLGGEWVVSGATKIATDMGLSKEFIGLTIVAIGTSLPELVTSVVAARRKNIDIAVGNIIGSNIFNLLWVLGISASIKPLPFDVINNVDILVMLGAIVMIIPAIASNKSHKIGRLWGVIFVVFYIVYLYYLIVRG